jgi:deoxyribose-phosphate aldolase
MALDKYFIMGNESRKKARLSAADVMGLIDYTNLMAFSTDEQIKELVNRAARLGTYAVCILPEHALLARNEIERGKLNLKLAVTVDYPLGGGLEDGRIGEIKSLIGIADEIDAMMRIGALKSRRFKEVENDMVALTQMAHSGDMRIKMIIETAYLTEKEKLRACEMALEAGVDFIKTSSGYAEKDYTVRMGNTSTGATVDDVKLIAAVSKRMKKDSVGIKASGGIRSAGQILDLLRASGRKAEPGSFRIGASSIDNIYDELNMR